MYGIVLIAVLALMGGAIAYIGDKLGSKIGKKRLSVFGLRPRHTSILVTIITGILIAASAIGVMSLASRDVRTALFGMDALKQNLAVLSQDVEAKNQELTASRTEMDRMSTEYDGLKQKVADTAQQLNNVNAELTAVTVERDKTAVALTSLQTDYAQAQGDLAGARGEISSLEATKAELDGKVSSLTAAKASLQTDIDRLNKLTDNLKQGLQYVRESVVVYRAGESLTKSVVKGGQSLPETEKQLTTVVYRANQAVMVRLGVPQDKMFEALWISQADFNKTASAISEAPNDMVVRVVAEGNTVYGEPVIGKLELFPNRFVYPARAVIYSDTASVQNASQAEEIVLAFLQRVNAEAIKQGMLPDPLQGTVGIMSGSQLFDTINRVKQFSGSRITLRAITADDIYTVGPLTIEIELQPQY